MDRYKRLDGQLHPTATNIVIECCDVTMSKGDGKGRRLQPGEMHKDEGLLLLPEAVLHAIFLSGYLSTYEVFSAVPLVSKRFHDLVYQQSCMFDITGCKRPLNMGKFTRLFKNLCKLQYLDLSFLSCSPASTSESRAHLKFPALDSILAKDGGEHLRYLSLRGTSVTDKNLGNKILSLHSLMYLDLSKSCSQRFHDIGDVSMAKIGTLSNLHWLNISGTSVTDDGLRSLVTNKTQKTLKYLSVQLCCRLTCVVTDILRLLPLVALDISGVASLTNQSITTLVDPRYGDIM